uniref:Uncharacterized protein n=1 Tax=Tanacetum cinerariifolium TaxID=118510 RepID=A0A6L2K1X3_TANCI|nr:hypothetical protein [Tanacetum cinerariifolium]
MEALLEVLSLVLIVIVASLLSLFYPILKFPHGDVRVVDPSYLEDQPNLRPTFAAVGFDCILDINEKICPIFVLQFYKSVCLVRNLNGTFSIAFIIRNVKFTLRLEEFDRILLVPCHGTSWENLKGQRSRRYPQPLPNGHFRIKTQFKKWKIILSENAISLTRNKDHPNAFATCFTVLPLENTPFPSTLPIHWGFTFMCVGITLCVRMRVLPQKGLLYAKGLLRQLEIFGYSERSKDVEDTSSDAGRYGIAASVVDIADKESFARLRDRCLGNGIIWLCILTRSVSMFFSLFSENNAWGLALIRMEPFAQARVKFKQALQLYTDDPASVIQDITNTIEESSPADVSYVRSM